MQSFQFKCPTEIIFGRGAEEKVGEKIKAYGGTHVYIVYGGGSVIRSGLLARVERTLTESGIAFDVRGGVQPNPLVSHAREGVREALRRGLHPRHRRRLRHRHGESHRARRRKPGDRHLGFLVRPRDAHALHARRRRPHARGGRQRDERLRRPHERGDRRQGRHQHAVQSARARVHEP